MDVAHADRLTIADADVGEASSLPDTAAPFFNRELSLLEFNRRVLEQAIDTGTPLLERLRFLAISSTNLDEFFEIRVAGLHEQVEAGVKTIDPDGFTAKAALDRVIESAQALVAEQYRVLNDRILPELAAEGVRVIKRSQWTSVQREWVRRYFREQVRPVVTPRGLDLAHPFPKILNKSLNFIVSVRGHDAFDRDSGVAIVQAPRILPRLIQFPPGVAEGDWDFTLLTSVIHAHVGELFPGMSVDGCHQFRLTRDSDLWVDEEEVDDLLDALQGELVRRKYGDALRLEVTTNCSAHLTELLLEHFELDRGDLFQVDGPVNVNRLSALYDLVDRPDLKYPPFRQGVPASLRADDDVFETIRRGDLLLYHPFESFGPVVELIRQAARDPDVLAIRQTLYRTGKNSPLRDALLEAARAGKEVTAVVELRARFDEAENIELAQKLQNLGAGVVYGVVGYKTHAKMLQIVRREGSRLRRYMHLGTGNYHTGTTRAYTDWSFLTCDEVIAEDVHRIFQQLTGFGEEPKLEKLYQSPFALHRRLVELIAQEAEEARAGRPAKIIAKMNSLIEPEIIRSLYAASQAGVEIDLIVRGTCSLRPGVPGLSERIRVRSIVGRFLEHSRIFYFYAGGAETTYLSSADWMARNFFRRIEVAFPIEDARLRRRVIEEGLLTYLEDNVQAWELQADGSYRRLCPQGEAPPHRSQDLLLADLGAS